MESKLKEQVRRIVEAGHLAPWHMAHDSFCNLDRGIHSNPGDTLYFLSMVRPLLDDELKARTDSYVRGERSKYPPETMAVVPFGEGTRRKAAPENSPTMVKFITLRQENQNFHLRNGLVPIENLYAPSCYYEDAATKPAAEEWRKMNELLIAHLRNRDWASLGFFLWSPLAAPNWKQDRIYGYGGQVETNALFAGMVGYSRLAHLMGDREAENRGMCLLALAAAQRYAMDKANRYFYAEGFRGLKEGLEPDWCLQMDCSGQFALPKWTGAEDDVARIFAMNEFFLRIGQYSVYPGTRARYFPYFGMVSELGRFLKGRRPAVSFGVAIRGAAGPDRPVSPGDREGRQSLLRHQEGHGVRAGHQDTRPEETITLEG